MKQTIILALAVFTSIICDAQKTETVYLNPRDSSTNMYIAGSDAASQRSLKEQIESIVVKYRLQERTFISADFPLAEPVS